MDDPAKPPLPLAPEAEPAPLRRFASRDLFAGARDNGRRRILHDLDMAILALRQTYGAIPPAVSLTGTYHNLLRRWAEV